MRSNLGTFKFVLNCFFPLGACIAMKMRPTSYPEFWRPTSYSGSCCVVRLILSSKCVLRPMTTDLHFYFLAEFPPCMYRVLRPTSYVSRRRVSARRIGPRWWWWWRCFVFCCICGLRERRDWIRHVCFVQVAIDNAPNGLTYINIYQHESTKINKHR